MSLQKNTFLPIPLDGLKFNFIIKSNITLIDGRHSVMFTIVPEGIECDEVIAGTNKCLSLSYKIKSVWHELISVKCGVLDVFGKTIERSFNHERK